MGSEFDFRSLKSKSLSTTEGDGGILTLSLASYLGALCKGSQLLSNSCSRPVMFQTVVSLTSVI